MNQLQQAIRGAPGNLQDAELLERFIRRRDEAAFEVLLWRHGPMVLGVCRRVLRDMHAAEDAFQATFLLLAQKAVSIGNGRSIGSWLYKVAYRVAQRARRRSARRPACTSDVDKLLAPAEKDACVSQEQHSLLDDAIQRLPERYRVPVVLCYVQGKKIRETAAELGCPTATVSTRLRRARALLERDLKDHGVTSSTADWGAVFAAHVAVPGQLANKAVYLSVAMSGGNGLAAGAAEQVIALAKEVSHAMVVARAKAVGVLVAGLVLLLATGGATALRLARRAEAQQPPAMTAAPRAASSSERAPGKQATKPAGGMVVDGRVLGMDGKPAAAVSVYALHFLKEHALNRPEEIELASRARTGADGRYRFELPASDRPSDFEIPVVAAAPGYGCDWRTLPHTGSPDTLDLRLTKDQPIRGRIVDTEGKPLAGVRVGQVVLFASSEQTLDDFLRVWKTSWLPTFDRLPKRLALWPSLILPSTQTDSAGRFELRGVGVERVARLTIEGAGIAKRLLHVVTREGFDPGPYNRARNALLMQGRQRPGRAITLYGPTFEYVAERSRVIEGTVRDADTQQPLADVSISGNAGRGPVIVFTTSDAAGRYRLVGLGKAPQYSLAASTRAKGPWLDWHGDLVDSEGLAPLHVDIPLRQGIIIRGQVVDRATGKGVRAGVRTAPLPDNRFFAKPGYDVYLRTWSATDADGNFQITSIPGPSAILVTTQASGGTLNGFAVDRYTCANPDPRDCKRLGISLTGAASNFGSEGGAFGTAGRSTEFLGQLNGCKCIDVPEKGDVPSCTIDVDPGRTASIEIEDPDGKPLPGTCVSGMTCTSPIAFRLAEPRCTVYGIERTTPRTVLFYHKARKLAAALEVRGEEPQPLRVRLGPTAALTGRLLDPDGKALTGITVDLWMPETSAQLFDVLGEPSKQVLTDGDGHFRLDGLVPESDVGVFLHRGATPLRIQKRIGTRRVPPGKTLDLGDIRSSK
jgi:RNA polymerase sigma factor (sigma-70 family)